MIRKIWNWLDGNKLTIGSMLGMIAAHVPADVEIAGVSVSGALYWLGGVIGGTGVGHKAKKIYQKKVSP